MLRLAVITLLIGIMFGILQYFPPEKTFETIGMGAILKGRAISFFYVVMPCFVIYLIFLGFNARYKRTINLSAPQEFFYDLGISLIIYIALLIIGFALSVKLLVVFPNFPMKVITSFIWILIFLAALVPGEVIMGRIPLFQKRELNSKVYIDIMDLSYIKVFSRLKKDKLIKTFLSPIILVIILLLFSFITNMNEDKFIVWVETLGLILITYGAVLGIRPVVRSLLNPKVKENNKLRRDINAGLMAFHYLIVGFGLQFIAKFYLLIPSYATWAWTANTLAVTIIAYFLVIKQIKKLGFS